MRRLWCNHHPARCHLCSKNWRENDHCRKNGLKMKGFEPVAMATANWRVAKFRMVIELVVLYILYLDTKVLFAIAQALGSKVYHFRQKRDDTTPRQMLLVLGFSTQSGSDTCFRESNKIRNFCRARFLISIFVRKKMAPKVQVAEKCPKNSKFFAVAIATANLIGLKVKSNL